MAPSSSDWSHHVPAVIKGHRHFGYGGSALPESIPIRQFYDITATKRSNVRLNDQLMPKPSDINIAERMIKVPIPREHPYQSHISRFAVFPTFRSPDDPDTGIRAASQRPLNPLIPASAPQVTVLSKTKGGPYRHEVLEAPMSARNNAMAWPGQHGFLDYTKPVKGEGQVFYPKAQKTVFPNSTLRDWDITLSECTANMLRNVERSHWVTSYQLHFTGSGPTNPLMMDDFHHKTIDRITGKMAPYTAQLRERSHPVLVPPAPQDGRKARARQGRRTLESSYRSPDPTFAEPLDPGLTSTQTPRPLGSLGGHYRTPRPDHSQGDDVATLETSYSLRPELTAESHSRQASRAGLGPVERTLPSANTDRSLALFTRQRPGSTHETDGPKDNTQILRCEDVPISRRDNYTAGSNMSGLSQREFTDNMSAVESGTEWSSKHALDRDWQAGEVQGSSSNPSIRPRPPALPSVRPPGRRHSALLQLQDSFSKTEVQRRFHSALQGATVDLRDHCRAGRKNKFYGFNSYYFHN